MQWLNKVIDQLVTRGIEREIIIESGISPSGSYHMGYLREILICDAILLELRERGYKARHIHFVDDQDGFRKVPANLPSEYEKYLGMPLCDMPAPDGSDQSYADYALADFLSSVKKLGVDFEPIRSHERYRAGFFVPAIERVLGSIDAVKQVLEDVAGRKLADDWSPIQVNEDGYLKKRPFVSVNTDEKTILYLDKESQQKTISYIQGDVKLDWRLDWPARWWLMNVDVEPFGRDHGTKGGSYDTGQGLIKSVFNSDAPLPVPYDFINRAGDTKKMSASKGNGILMSEVVSVLPVEVVRYFVLRSDPGRALFFDPIDGVIRLVDEYAELLAKPDKSDDERMLIRLSTNGLESIVSSVPFSHLVTSYQASLRDPAATLDVIRRSEYGGVVDEQADIIKKELAYIDQWLEKWAPEDVTFSLKEIVDVSKFDDNQKKFMATLADKIAQAPADADGTWFHQAIYELKDETGLAPKELFTTLYQAIIDQDSGPRAGWFLSLLPRDWLVSRLRLEL